VPSAIETLVPSPRSVRGAPRRCQPVLIARPRRPRPRRRPILAGGTASSARAWSRRPTRRASASRSRPTRSPRASRPRRWPRRRARALWTSTAAAPSTVSSADRQRASQTQFTCRRPPTRAQASIPALTRGNPQLPSPPRPAEATRRGLGAVLLRKPTKLARLVSGIVAGSELPVTVKIRTGEGGKFAAGAEPFGARAAAARAADCPRRAACAG
jgi:hypothetical protein